MERRQRTGVLPGAAMATAVAALAVFVVAQRPEGVAAEPMSYDAARQHLRKPPIEVQGARVSPWLEQNFLPDVPVPRLGNDDPVGARLSHLSGREAALIYYRPVIGGRSHEVQLRLIDASGLNLDWGRKAVVGGRTVWVDAARGVSVVTYRASGNWGFVFTSADMQPVDLVDLVANSDLMLRIRQRVQGR